MSALSNQEQAVSRFVALLGTKASQKDSSVASSLVSTDPTAAATRELLLCLSKNVENHEVVCTLPSLDMRKVEEEAGANLLPDVGEHRETTSTVSGGRPQMAASVLNVSNTADASAKAAQVEQKAAQSLGSLTSWTKSSVEYASRAVAKNVADSFSSLVNSRVQAWTILLLRHSLTTGDSGSRSRLLTMLSSIIKVKSAQTNFKTLALPKSAMGHAKEADVILPLLLEVDMQVSIQSKIDTVTLRAPGTISGNFENNGAGPGLVKADIRLDTSVMLDSMVQQARMVVFKAVAKATSATEELQLDAKVEPSKKPDPGLSPSLSGFSSALNISSGGASEGTQKLQLQKSRASALKLNSVLQGDSRKPMNPGLDKSKKTKSVQWDHSMDIPKTKKSPANPSPKRQRLSNTEARLRSFKSFGRPHAGDFGSGPRNATFGDFGRGPIWGRDGKLANHPAPMQPNYDGSQDLMSTSTVTKKNATFDFQRPAIHLSSGLDLGKKSGSRMNQAPGAMPRTATAQEGLLMKKFLGNTF